MRGIRIPHLHKVVCNVQRDHEKHLPGKGALALNLGILLALFLFDSPLVALGGLTVLAYGDAASAIVGKRFGRRRLHRKSGRTIEGTVAGMLVSAAFLAIFFPLQTALAAATAGMLAEYIPPDDSFTIPVVSALALMLMGV
jgi:dolichol kinase